MRRLWTGEVVTAQGTHYDVDTARIYTLPDEPPPVYELGVHPGHRAPSGSLRDYVEAGYDEVYVANMGPHTSAIEAYGRDVLPALRN